MPSLRLMEQGDSPCKPPWLERRIRRARWDMGDALKLLSMVGCVLVDSRLLRRRASQPLNGRSPVQGMRVGVLICDDSCMRRVSEECAPPDHPMVKRFVRVRGRRRVGLVPDDPRKYGTNRLLIALDGSRPQARNSVWRKRCVTRVALECGGV